MNNPEFFSGIAAARLTVTAVLATVFGYVARFLGGFDSIMITLVTLIVLDYVTGVIGAIYEKKLSSAIGYKGIFKKALMLLVVGLSVSLQSVLPQAIPLREITILFFIANEGLSILENAAKIIPLPKKLKAVLLQLKDKDTDNTESGNKESGNTEQDKEE